MKSESDSAAPAGTPAGKKSLLRFALGVAGFGAIMAYAISHESLLLDTRSVLGETSWIAYCVGLACYVSGLAVSTCRFRLFVESTGQTIRFRTLFGDLIKSTGLNALTLSGVGEFYRVRQLQSHGLGWAEASAIVLSDRFLGLALILATGLVGFIYLGAEWASGFPARAGAIGIVVVAGVALWVAMRLRGRPDKSLTLPSIAQRLIAPRSLFSLIGFSLGTVFFWIASVVAFAEALGIGAAPLVIAASTPLVTLATMLPISIGGVGIREAGYSILLAPHGVETAQAVGLGLLQYSSFLFVAALAGGLLFRETLRRKHLPTIDPLEAGGSS